jgi:hypothetical protein
LLGPLLLVSWGGLAAARAQAPAAPLAPPRTYVKKRELSLPIVIDPRVQTSLREVQLWFKDDPAQGWKYSQAALPTQKEFPFKAAGDGEYWFTIVTMDRAGHRSPSDLTSEPPGVIVVVDTQAPQVDLKALPGGDATCVQCVIRDTNPDPSKTRFEFQTGDMQWHPLDAQAGKPDTFRLPPEAVTTGKVRVAVLDKAGNTTTREMDVGTAPTATAAAPVPPSPPAAGKAGASAVLVVEGGGPALPPAPGPKDTKVVQAGHTEPAEAPKPRPAVQVPPYEARKVAPPRSLPDVPLAGPVPPAEHPACREPARPAASVPGVVKLVNTRRVILEYKIDQTGPSGVGKVEVWLTRDRGQSWERFGEDADRVSPAEVTLPGEGLFGLTLVVSNGRGFGGTPPASGDVPDCWFEVDMTKPVAEIVSVTPSQGSDPGAMVITWNARDKNLAAQPIDLYWSAGRHGRWTPIAKGLRNDREYRWSVPAEVGAQAYIRMTVTDAAGNVAECVTAEAVPIDDLSRPRIRVVGFTTGGAQTGPELHPSH